MHSTGEHVHILRNTVDKLARAYSNASLKQLFTVERCQASALLNVHVSLYFSWDGQMNMLQVSSYTGQNLQTTNQESKTNLSFSLTTWEHSLSSSLSKHFILPCFHLGITNLQGLRISQHGFFNINVAIELPSEYDWNCTVRQKNRNSFTRFKEYLFVSRNSFVCLTF